MTEYKTFVNIYREATGLWTASLFSDGKEIDALGGSYPKSNSVAHDAAKKWGRKTEVVLTYIKLFPDWNVSITDDDAE